jgi:multidrug resistance efflux pump
VAAPFAGVLEKSLVKPGDVVVADQVLGLMDGKEISWELASVAAEQQRVSKAYDVNLAAGKVAAAQIDRLEMERLEQKRRLLEHRSANLQIKSPIDGVLLSGDLKRSEGVPLTLGQTLYEVAPLEQMIVEVLVADEEVSLVEAGQTVTIRLAAAAGQSRVGRLERIHPRSEVCDNENVFIGEVALTNEGSLLRPGMKGEATVIAARQRLGWILFHSAWNKLTNWLRW